MKIIFVGGGTSGHVNPAINMINFIKKNYNDDILYVGTSNSIEENLVKNANIDFKSVNISGFSRKLNLKSIFKNFSTMLKIFICDKQSKKIIKEFKPDICVGTGGYVCGPFLRRAHKMKIPFVILEQNSIPGLTTKLLSKKANKILFALPTTETFFEKNKIHIVGNPIGCRDKISRKESIRKINEKYDKKINYNSKIVLSFGGSLGSDVINKTMIEIIKNSNFFHIHAYGNNYENFYNDLIKNEKSIIENNIITKYIDDMYNCLNCADLVICRSGAMTISELAFFAKPAILIPSPNVVQNHQYFNALSLFKINAAFLLEEKKIKNPEVLKSIMENILNDKETSEKFSRNIKKISIPDSSKKIYDILLKVLK